LPRLWPQWTRIHPAIAPRYGFKNTDRKSLTTCLQWYVNLWSNSTKARDTNQFELLFTGNFWLSKILRSKFSKYFEGMECRKDNSKPFWRMNSGRFAKHVSNSNHNINPAFHLLSSKNDITLGMLLLFSDNIPNFYAFLFQDFSAKIAKIKLASLAIFQLERRLMLAFAIQPNLTSTYVRMPVFR